MEKDIFLRININIISSLLYPKLLTQKLYHLLVSKNPEMDLDKRKIRRKKSMKKIHSGIRDIMIVIVSLTMLVSCGKNDHCVPSPDISGINIALKVERIDKQLFAVKSEEELAQLIEKNPVFAEVFLSRSQYPDDSVLVKRFFQLLQDKSIDTLWQETQHVFGDFAEIEEQFTDAFRHIKYFYPDFNAPEIKTVFTGLAHDMYLSDSLIIIGLDYYLGEEASFRPLNTPEYILKRYRKENIVPNTLLFMSEKHNATNPEDQSLLADMVYYGKSYFFAKQMLPCVPDSIFLGYSPQEMDDIDDNKGVIWANFIENELLFETSHFIKDKFISERPHTLEISQKCPGRIGRWIGWEIVKEYQERNEKLSFTEIMQNSDAREIFAQSKFKPRI
jgi:gliding motility-associated lipoprotein GldB